MKRGILIYNPTAGQRNRPARMNGLIELMRRRGLELLPAPTTSRGHATEIVRTHLPQGIDLVAVFGGDGTISEAAAGLAGSSVPLGILPGGTSNVLARELSIPLDLGPASELLLQGEQRTVHVLLANERPFLLWAGVGLDARIMRHMNLLLKRWLGRAGIFFTVAPEFFRYEFPRLEVTVDGETYPATFAVICHARHYAGDWIVAPEARLESELMDVLLFSGRSRWRFLSLFHKVREGKGRHLSKGIAQAVRGRVAQVRSLETYPVEVQLDGDCLLETPVTCRPAEASVQVLVPRSAARREA